MVGQHEHTVVYRCVVRYLVLTGLFYASWTLQGSSVLAMYHYKDTAPYLQSTVISFLTADMLMHERKADMDVWLIKAQPAVSVCPTCCMSEEILCCGSGWVPYIGLWTQTWFKSGVSESFIQTLHILSLNTNFTLSRKNNTISENHRREQTLTIFPCKTVEEITN